MQGNTWASKNILLVLLCMLCATVSSFDLRGREGSEVGHSSHGTPSKTLIARAPPDAESSKKRWVFAVNPGFGKHPAFTDIDKHIASKLGSDATEIKNNKIIDLENNVAWFYANSDEKFAQDVVEKWNKIASALTKNNSTIDKTAIDLEIDENPKTFTIKNDKPSRVRRALETREARPELCALSLNPGTAMPNPCQYITDDSQGSGVTVYIIGSGANLDHTDFDHLDRKSVEFIFSDPQNNKKREDRLNIRGKNVPLGTAILSKLCGSSSGVAKRVTPIIVKVTDTKGNVNNLDHVQGLMSTLSSITAKTAENSKAEFIVLDTVNIYDVPATGGAAAALKTIKENDNIYAYPGLLGRPQYEEEYPKLLAVGGVDKSYKAVNNVDSWVKTYAPAEDILAAGNLPAEYMLWQDASLAVPAVAGVLATFMSKDRLGTTEALSQLELFAYSRGSTSLHRHVVYNAVWQDISKPTSKSGREPTWDGFKWDAGFCERCRAANGETPIDNTLWLPKDCPCGAFRDSGS
ncbi:hypothetical protein TWF481_009170 [Arthrobotrys musiformis]|uniref:Peptidase S8/S53 domain-containing protein n=1 Tax=Arthrobotrys musiformis TaxID=47236 RepID=A0AAV9W5I0_9PEZI